MTSPSQLAPTLLADKQPIHLSIILKVTAGIFVIS